jgi:hypothetical protein
VGLSERWDEFEKELQLECAAAGRPRGSVELVAVTKGLPVETVQQAYELGCRDFGESRLQEALPKIAALPPDARWHMVGRLQSNKARNAARAFQVLHSLCNARQLGEIQAGGATVGCYVQVNVAEEPQKDGVFIKELDNFWELATNCPQVRCLGLMAIAPEAADPEQARWVFRSLAEQAKRLGTTGLSMGMSGDWRVALHEGATCLRIGRTLFGGRK